MLISIDDVLSEKGKFQELWSTTMESFKTSDENKLIIESLEESIINHLFLSDKDCISSIESYHNLIGILKESAISGELFDKLCEFDLLLEEYITKDTIIKCKSPNTFLNVYDQNSTAILCTMLNEGFIDPNKVQGLLDNQNQELITITDNLMGICNRSQSPSSGRSGINSTSPLSFHDFGTDVSKIIDCTNKFITDNDLIFPTSALEVLNIIFPIEKFDSQVLYNSQDNYISNKVRYDILRSTIKKIKESFEVDKETGITILSDLMNSIKDIINDIKDLNCLVLYMAIGLVLLGKIDQFDSEMVPVIKDSIKKELVNAIREIVIQK